jgi:hypothetical protein
MFITAIAQKHVRLLCTKLTPLLAAEKEELRWVPPRPKAITNTKWCHPAPRLSQIQHEA